MMTDERLTEIIREMLSAAGAKRHDAWWWYSAANDLLEENNRLRAESDELRARVEWLECL